MKKLLLATFLALSMLSLARASETVVVLNPQGPSHSGTPQLLALIDHANRLQSKYRFVLEFKTGAFESLALKDLAQNPQNKISTMTNASVEAFDRGLVNSADLIPIFSQGDSCWAVIGHVNKNLGLDSFKHVDEIIVGGPAIGGATHLAALEIGRRYNKPVRYIVYKSNFDAFVNMVSDGSINFIFERVKNYENFKNKNPKIHMLAMSCPNRHADAPEVKTLKEFGIHSPYIWQHIVAHTTMSREKIKELEKIFSLATKQIGQTKIHELSDQTPAIFQNISNEQHFRQSLNAITDYRQRYSKEIKESR